MNNRQRIKVSKDGPYLVSGSLPLEQEIIIANKADVPVKWEKGKKYPDKQNYALCRCGASKNKPFCDGTHNALKFDGAETAKQKTYQEMAKTTRGPELDLSDAESLCAVACFCHRAGDAWNLTENSNDPVKKALAIEEACDCPSGRLVAWEKTAGTPIEPKLEPSVSIVEIPYAEVSGPIWVKGGIPIEAADGYQYEARNRATLCRCGRSSNKPFCDGTHVNIKFNDGDVSQPKEVTS